MCYRCVAQVLETLVVHLRGNPSNVAIELLIEQIRPQFAHSEPIVSLSLSSSHLPTEFSSQYGLLRVTAASHEREREVERARAPHDEYRCTIAAIVHIRSSNYASLTNPVNVIGPSLGITITQKSNYIVHGDPSAI